MPHLPQPSCQVLIVGAGPTGVALANLLGCYGVQTQLIERHVGVTQIPRAVHLDGETMRTFQSMDMATELLSVLRQGSCMHWVNAEGKVLLVREGINGLGSHGWHNNNYYHQPHLEEALRRGLDRFDHVHLCEGWEVTQIAQDAQGASVSVRDTDGNTQTLQAQYVVGCDGARSMVRDLMGDDQGFDDLGEHQAWLVVDGVLNRPLDLPEFSVQYCDPKRPATGIFVNALRRRWELMLLPGEDPQALTREDKVWELISPWVKPSQARLERAATYTFHSLITKRWQNGRLFVAGDSAHQTPPFLGQGLCAGIRDAANLGWKLAHALQHPDSAQAVLQTYGPERTPHAKAFVQLAVDVGQIIQELDPVKAAQRDERLLREGMAFTFPSPPLGEGMHRAAPERAPVGQVAPQFEMPDGLWSDDHAKRGWSIWVLPECKLDATTRALADQWDMTFVSATAPRMADWLRNHQAVAAVLRPDHYLFDLCDCDAALQTSLQTLSRFQS